MSIATLKKKALQKKVSSDGVFSLNGVYRDTGCCGTNSNDIKVSVMNMRAARNRKTRQTTAIRESIGKKDVNGNPKTDDCNPFATSTGKYIEKVAGSCTIVNNNNGVNVVSSTENCCKPPSITKDMKPVVPTSEYIFSNKKCLLL